MYDSQGPYRDLYDALLSDEDPLDVSAMLRAWLTNNPQECRWLEGLGGASGTTWPSLDTEALCRLYALSRVNEILLLGFQPRGPAQWQGPSISRDHYVAFMTRLGMHSIHHAAFHPFFHEVVTIQPNAELKPAATAAPEPTLLEELWPCMMLGDLMFSRAGCVVYWKKQAPNIDPEVAPRSMLYWAHRRQSRPTQDLSCGWGGNSQWRTRFRRDYRIADTFHFNVDGKLDALQTDPLTDRDGLSAQERIELLTHRGFVTTRKPDADLWPWDDRYSIKATQGPY